MQPIALAGCVILDDAGRLLLLHRNTPRLTQWELPGGKLEANETLEQAATRETLEELGVEVRLSRKIGETEFDDNGSRWHYTWFRAEIVSGTPRAVETQKHDDVQYFDVSDPDIAQNGISINIVQLLNAVKKRLVQL